MKRCTNCQAELARDAAFCNNCGLGAPVGDTVPESPVGVSLDPTLPGDATDPAIGQVIDGKYRIERVLGEGGMGVVYLARSIHTDIELVLKAVRPEIAHRRDVRDRTMAEGKALARIDHPNVVQLKSVVANEHELWLVMQYIEGGDLEAIIRQHASRGERLALAEALQIFMQVLAGVGAAHDEGVIHRDLKPANILVRAKDGVVKVTDFGIAKPEEDARAGRGKTQGIIGSLNYMSPEQVTGQRDLDRRVDIYALGMMLFEMLGGKPPFDADNTYELLRMHVEFPLPSLLALRPDVPPALEAILQKACAKKRDDRYGSCAEFMAALQSIGATHAATVQQRYSSVTPMAPAVSALPPTQSLLAPQAAQGTITSQVAELPGVAMSKRPPWWLAAVGAIVVVGAVGTLFATGIIGGSDETKPADDEPSGTTKTPKQAAPPPSASVTEPSSPLARLAGRWVASSGRVLNAVVIGDTIEFQVVTPSQFSPQDYQADEARFVLRRIADESNVFAVEDRIRPVPPTGHTYAGANARGTCLGVWTEASGKPLRAQLAGDRLNVDFAKIEPSGANFVLAGGGVASCRGLEKLPAVRLPGVFNRE